MKPNIPFSSETYKVGEMLDPAVALAGCLGGAAVTAIVIPISIRLSQKCGLLGKDVHKEDQPILPKIGGLSIVIGTSVAVLLFDIFLGSLDFVTHAFIFTPLIAAAIGMAEDWREIRPVLKTALTILPGVVISVLGTYDPRPVLPIIGGTRLTIVYPILIPIAIAVTSNSVNSIDTLNGSMASTSLITAATVVILSYLTGAMRVMYFAIILAGSLAVFLWCNKFPAKIFSGNVGSLYTGAFLGALAVVGRIEVAVMIAMMPQIMNEFYILSSLGGLRSGKEYEIRPTKVEKGLIRASPDRRAPLTLVRFITARIKMREDEIVKATFLLSVLSSALALVTHIFLIGE